METRIRLLTSTKLLKHVRHNSPDEITVRVTSDRADFDEDQPPNAFLLLTGDNRDMRSAPPAFRDIPPASIISQPQVNVVEVTLETAVKFLCLLEGREEEANAEYRALNFARREAIYKDLHDSAVDLVETMHKRQQELPPEDDKTRRICKLPVSLAYSELSEDDEYQEILASSLSLRDV